MNTFSFDSRRFCFSNYSYEEAKVVLCGVPFDLTASYRPGSRFAPPQIRETSWEFEDYEFLTGENILTVPFYDSGDMDIMGGTEESLENIYSNVKSFVDDGKIPLAIGGEHLITLPIVKALLARYKALNMVVFDAHLDLKDTYAGRQLSHATVMKRVSELQQICSILYFGIRSATEEEKTLWMSRDDFFSHRGIDGLKRDIPLYISIDMDALDPSCAPGVGNPEPGGLTYREIYSILQELSHFTIVGADVVEISPPYDPSGITGVTGARIVRDLLFLIYKNLSRKR
jgi:agmatinase